MRRPEFGELSLSVCQGVGNRKPSRSKKANPQGYACPGGMVNWRRIDLHVFQETMNRGVASFLTGCRPSRNFRHFKCPKIYESYYGEKSGGLKMVEQLYYQLKETVARYCACTATIESGSWLTKRNRQKRLPATMRILRDFELFAGTSRMFENKWCLACDLFDLKNKESDCRTTMASNVAHVRLKRKIVFVRCEEVIFEVLKTYVYLAVAYLLVVRACFLAICIVKGLLQLF